MRSFRHFITILTSISVDWTLFFFKLLIVAVKIDNPNKMSISMTSYKCISRAHDYYPPASRLKRNEKKNHFIQLWSWSLSSHIIRWDFFYLHQLKYDFLRSFAFFYCCAFTNFIQLVWNTHTFTRRRRRRQDRERSFKCEKWMCVFERLKVPFIGNFDTM